MNLYWLALADIIYLLQYTYYKCFIPFYILGLKISGGRLSGSTSNALMDDSDFPPSDLQIDSKDSLPANYRVESLASHLIPSADENENQLDSDGNEVLTSSSVAMGRQDKGEQDNINNNENVDSGDCIPSCKESETETRSVNVHMDPQLEEKPITEKQPGGKRSPRSKRSSSKKSKGT